MALSVEARWRPLSLLGLRPRPPAASLRPAARERPRRLVPKGGIMVKRRFLRRDFLPFSPTHPGCLVQAFPTSPPPATLCPPLLPEARAPGAAARRDRQAHVGAGTLTQPRGGRALAAARYAFQSALLASNKQGRPRHELRPFGADHGGLPRPLLSWPPSHSSFGRDCTALRSPAGPVASSRLSWSTRDRQCRPRAARVRTARRCHLCSAACLISPMPASSTGLGPVPAPVQLYPCCGASSL